MTFECIEETPGTDITCNFGGQTRPTMAAMSGENVLRNTIGGTVKILGEVVNQPPLCTVTYPNGGEVVSGVVDVTATASDSDGFVVSMNFDYSPDAGASWFAIGPGILTDAVWSISWDTSAVAEGSDYLVRATAADNMGATSSDESDGTFAVGLPPPEADVRELPSKILAGHWALAEILFTDLGPTHTYELHYLIGDEVVGRSPLHRLYGEGLTQARVDIIAVSENFPRGTYTFIFKLWDTQEEEYVIDPVAEEEIEVESLFYVNDKLHELQEEDQEIWAKLTEIQEEISSAAGKVWDFLKWLVEHVIPKGLIEQATKKGYPMPWHPW